MTSWLMAYEHCIALGRLNNSEDSQQLDGRRVGKILRKVSDRDALTIGQLYNTTFSVCPKMQTSPEILKVGNPITV